MKTRKGKCLCGYDGRNDNLKRHQHTCSTFQYVESLKLELAQKTELLIQKDSQIIELLNQSKNKNITTTNNLNSTVNITNNTMNILTICPPFGSEPALERGQVKRILENTRFNCIDTLPEYIRQKYLNFDGYGNIRVVNKKGNKVEVIQEGETGEKRWVERDKSDTIHDMTEENIEEIIEQYYPQLKISGNFFNTYHKRLKRDDSEFKSLKVKVESVLTQNN